VVLAELSHRPLGNQMLRDPAGAPRVAIPGRDFAYYVDLACGQIRRYGRSEPRVMLALLRILRSTGRFCADDDTRAVLAQQVRLVLADAEAAIVQPADLAPVQQDAERVLREVSG